MSKKRPGVDAAIELLQLNNRSTEFHNGTRWEQVFARHKDVLGCISGLVDLDSKAKTLGEELRNERKYQNNNNEMNCISKQELLEIVIPWKFAVGKPRNALLGQLRSNTEEQVEHATALGISLAKRIPSTPLSQEDMNEQVKKAIEAVAELRGVGPATASVLLSWIRPDIFCYMYDEVLDCFLPKRTYTIQAYLDCRTKCQEYANPLKWTPEQVARTLWTAAKAKAMGVGVVVGGVGVDNNNNKNNKKKKGAQVPPPPLSPPPITTAIKASKRKAQESSAGAMGRTTRGARCKVQKI